MRLWPDLQQLPSSEELDGGHNRHPCLAVTSTKMLWSSGVDRWPKLRHTTLNGWSRQSAEPYPLLGLQKRTELDFRSGGICHFLLQAEDVAEETYGMRGCPCDVESYGIFKGHQLAHQEDPQILALTRQRMPAEMPKGKALENIKSQMLRIHKASGHSAFSNLQRLLRARQAPPWAVALSSIIISGLTPRNSWTF